MRVYRSQQEKRIRNSSDLMQVCGVPILPLANGSVIEGPCSLITTSDFKDIVAEALEMFRFNILLKNRYDIHSPPDKVLVYLMVWIRDLLAISDATPVRSVEELEALFVTAAKAASPLPGDEAFKMNQFFDQPASDKERTLCEKYLTQLRAETGKRLAARLWEGDSGVSKWWSQYRKITFMGF